MQRPHHHSRVLALLAVVTLSVAACGGVAAEPAADADEAPDTPTDTATDTPPDTAADTPTDAAGTCPEGTVDCVDTPGLDDEPVEIDETGIQQFTADAQHYLGRDESELPETIRIGRRGDEAMMLTEDYVIGRMTAELDDSDADGTYTVTSMTVELPDGPLTVTA